MTRKSPVHISVEKDQPVHLLPSPSKSRVRTSSPKRTPNKRGSSPAKEKPWIPAPCKSSKNKYTWAGSKGKLDITSPLQNHDTSSKIVIHVDSDHEYEPSLLDNVDNYRSKVADLSTEVDLLRTRADRAAKAQEIDALRDDLNVSLTEQWRRDKEIDIIQEDLLHTELENERLRSSLKQLCDTDIIQRRSQTKLQQEREVLLKRLVQVEADSLTAQRELSSLHSNIRQLKAEKDICEDDTDKLSRQREELLAKCAEAEDNNRMLRGELRENQLKLEDSGKLKAQHEQVLDRLTHSDGANRELRQSLSEMDQQISQLSRQIAVEKEEAEAYKHLQLTSEMSRSRTEEQLHESMGQNTRLERIMSALESDMELEKKEHNHTKGIFAGYKEKSHQEKEALRDKVRSYRDRALRSEEALEAVSAQLEAKSTKLRTQDGLEEALTGRIDVLVGDNTEMSDAIDTLKRKLYLAEEKRTEAEDELKTETERLRSSKSSSNQQVGRLESRCKQLQISIDSLNDRLKEKEEEINATAAQKEADAERLQHDVQFFKDRLREAEELLNRYKTDNIMLHQRVELAERDRGAMQHGNYMELEKVRDDYQAKLNELSHYPEKLSSAEARYQHAEAETETLRSQLADKHRSVEELNKKIDVFQEQIGKLKGKFHAVNEDNIELSNKTQSHERKVMEADLHNKNLMDLVSKKDDAVEQHQPLVDVDGKLADLPPPPASPSTDNNVSEEEKPVEEEGSETETESTDESESEEDVDWSEMLKSAEMNRQRLGLDNISDGESSADEDGNKAAKKKEHNGLTSHDIMNRMATNQFLGYDEFGRPLNGKYHGSMMSGKKGAKNRALLFGMDGGKRNKTGSNNRSAGKKDRSGRSGGRRSKKGGGNMALLGF